MSTTSDTRRHPVADALAGVHAAVDKAIDAPVWSLGDDELGYAVEECERAAARLAELKLRLVAEVDARDLGRRSGASSTAAWLRDRFRIGLGDARSLVEAAGRIAAGADVGDGPADHAANVSWSPTGREMPATGAALAAGELSEAHAVVISRAMRGLPDSLCAETCAEAERQFAGLARQYDPGTLAKMIDCLVEALAPESLEADEEAAIRRRELRLSERTGKLTGRFDPEALAMIRAMLDPLAAPQPTDDGSPDDRTPARRMADALVEVTRRVLNHTDWLPTRHGTRPHLALITELRPDTATAGTTATGSDTDSPDSPGRVDNGAEPNDAGAAGGATATDSGTAAASSKTHGGAFYRPRLGLGEPTWGSPLSSATVGRIACDAGITWIITDPAGVPLNVGREQRTVTPGQWAALVVRDGGCVFPGCTRTVEWCEAHHIIWWRFGGTTDLDNLCLLCAYHHRKIHHGGWDIRIAADRKPEFIPPPWVDPRQEPRRNDRPRFYRNKSPG